MIPSHPQQFLTPIKTIKGLILVNLCDELTKNIVPFLKFIRCGFKKQIKQCITITPEMLSNTSVLLDTKSFLNRMEFLRDYKATDKNQEANEIVDSILNFISKLDNVPNLQLVGNQTIVNFLDRPLQITSDIFVKIESITKNNETGVLETISFVLVSNTISASEISRWVKHIYKVYKENIKNSFGDQIYYFDQKNRTDQCDPRGNIAFSDTDNTTLKIMKLNAAPKQLGFVKNKFYSNKSFKNIFGTKVREIEERVNFFLNNKNWYDQKGLPYQLGLLLSGVPGSGKTSIIRAIANLTKRHILNVNFANITTVTQLKNLFFNENITFYSDDSHTQTQTLFLPLDQRIYVLEEIDSIGDIVHQRTEFNLPRAALPDELTLADILTVLDGTLECPGRIIIMTSNHPDVLDAALIRPGRIDVSVNFGNADKNLIVEMYRAFFDREFPQERIMEIPDCQLTAAEVGQVFFRHFKLFDLESVIQDLNSSIKC